MENNILNRKYDLVLSLYYHPQINSDELVPVTLPEIDDTFYCSTKNLYDTWKL